MGNITSANAVLMLSIPSLFNVPQQIQGFATDDIYDIPSIRSAEVQMGVDGVLSAGFVFTQIPQTIILQASSESNLLFDTWWLSSQDAKNAYPANGILQLPSISTKIVQTKGFLTGYKPAPAGKRVLQPRTYEITWEKIAPAPV